MYNAADSPFALTIALFIISIKGLPRHSLELNISSHVFKANLKGYKVCPISAILSIVEGEYFKRVAVKFLIQIFILVIESFPMLENYFANKIILNFYILMKTIWPLIVFLLMNLASFHK